MRRYEDLPQASLSALLWRINGGGGALQDTKDFARY